MQTGRYVVSQGDTEQDNPRIINPGLKNDTGFKDLKCERFF